MAELTDLVTGPEAAQILGVDPSTVSRWSDERLLPEARKLTPVHRVGGYKLFRRADVERLAAELAEARSA